MIIKDNWIIDFKFKLERKLEFEKEAEFINIFKKQNQRILIPFLDINFVNLSKEDQKFIIDRTVIKSDDWIFDSPEDFLEELENKNVYWCECKNEEEFIDYLEDDYFFYTCVIIDKDIEDIRRYTYLLQIEENYIYKGQDYRSLYIKEGNGVNFGNDMLEKVRTYIKRNICTNGDGENAV